MVFRWKKLGLALALSALFLTSGTALAAVEPELNPCSINGHPTAILGICGPKQD